MSRPAHRHFRLSIADAIALAVLAGVLAGSPSPSHAAAEASPSAQTDVGAAPRSGDNLPCPDCNPPQRLWRGLGELMIVQMIPWTVNSVIRDAEWAHIGPDVWWTNFENPWQWDNNKFLNNQFSHPYHGQLYFNAGRSNGYDFWHSTLFAFGGSLMWEIGFEGWAPSPNDWYNTSLGGITLGEMLYRVSTLTLDNTATGSERTFREIGAALLNPVGGFNRLIEGRMNDVSANPPEWRPSRIWGTLDLGYRRTAARADLDDKEGGADQTDLRFVLYYGDQVDDLVRKPFSAFMVEAALISKNTIEARGSALGQLYARGNLGGWELSRSERTQHTLAAFMSYEYSNSPAYEFGGQVLQMGLVSRFGEPRGFRIVTEALGQFAPISALRSDHFTTEEGRDYDYGPGFGAHLYGRAVWSEKGMISLMGRVLYTPIVSGFNGDHFQSQFTAESRFYPRGRLGLGASYTFVHRSSHYNDFADVESQGAVGKVFASLAIPRWREE